MIYYKKVLQRIDEFNALRRINADAEYQLKALKKLNKAILELQAYQREHKQLLITKINKVNPFKQPSII